jgi:hypothetical protein
VQLLASVLGGYLAGRLRTRWVTVHTDEVFFRDTAHGFLAWALSTLLMATLLSSAIGTAIASGLEAGGAVAKTAAHVATAQKPDAGPLGYYVDSLLRVERDRAAPPAGTPAPANSAPPNTPDRAPEVTRIFANALQSGELPDADRQYLGQVVAERTGLAQPEAEQRVTDTLTRLRQSMDQAAAKAKQVADDARKASALLALWLVVSLFVGAFVASYSATLGGRLRDSSVLAT